TYKKPPFNGSIF
uniref:SIFamide related peptide n=2 Tax=Paraneoptera TaxID=33342 RepID=FAR2_RHOPR|nr:RecName: Full=SIFamide related peptide; Short=Rhopr-SIFa; Contains: RecName: Full=SIFamide related peptide(2-12); Short=Rhopr-SIFa(2-12); Contains: RecName: Full=SIFamide related peptide(3-12); Short=Rhopr-SIFa(3-12); Contains: RecName: Full=SIFamide related peptide(4-12); Short=Rhopr-SIFa(4-12) [Rhodnius prolixus]